jgi:hypothetical protein
MYRLLSLFIVVAAAAVAAEPGCTTIVCGVGTIERNGECAPADDGTDPATCGSGTTLVGDRCVTTVECGEHTRPVVGSDGSVTCESTGTTPACGVPLDCPQPSPGKMTVCGQLYDIETMQEFRGSGAMGEPCVTATADGPCALRMDAFDAIDFATHAGSSDPATPLQVGDTYLDDCGRYRFEDVPMPSSPFVGLGFDDKDASKAGPPGATNAVGVATAFASDATVNLEAFVATKATTDKWQGSGGPPLSGGIYVAIFRAHKCDFDGTTCTGDPKETQPGVQIYKDTLAVPNNDYYFADTDNQHTQVDPSLTVTGSNGTGLLTGASAVTDQIKWTGMGGISDTTNCAWEHHAAASLANIVTFQIYRPTNQIGKTCNQ